MPPRSRIFLHRSAWLAVLLKHNLLNLRYVGNGKIWINNGCPDFLDERNKLIVEVYYEYFKEREYGSIQKYKELRRKLFTGYDVLFFNMKDPMGTLFLRFQRGI